MLFLHFSEKIWPICKEFLQFYLLRDLFKDNKEKTEMLHHQDILVDDDGPRDLFLSGVCAIT